MYTGHLPRCDHVCSCVKDSPEYLGRIVNRGAI